MNVQSAGIGVVAGPAVLKQNYGRWARTDNYFQTRAL